MRKAAIVLIAAGLFTASGCGCFEKWTDPRFDDRPIPSGDGITYCPRDPAEYPDPDQPAWQRFLFGTRFVGIQELGRRPYPPSNIRDAQ